MTARMSLKSKTLLGAVALMALAGFGTSAEAVPIPGLFNTGVDASGNALVGGDGVADPHYNVIASTLGGTLPRSAVTYAHPIYWPNDANSRWISSSADGNLVPSIATFRISFDLGGLDPNFASVIGLWGVDNIGEIFLNGVDTGIGLPFGFPTFMSLHYFAIKSGFVAGVNNLDFVVTDTGAPLAFRVDQVVGSVPEPATLSLMGAGLLLLNFMRRRRGRRTAFKSEGVRI